KIAQVLQHFGLAATRVCRMQEESCETQMFSVYIRVLLLCRMWKERKAACRVVQGLAPSQNPPRCHPKPLKEQGRDLQVYSRRQFLLLTNVTFFHFFIAMPSPVCSIVDFLIRTFQK